jgi:hypothetical protein
MPVPGISGGAGGGGGFQSSSSTSATSGDADGMAGSGNKQFNFGGNPNAGRATSAIESTLANPFVIIGVIALAWITIKKKR